METEKIVHEKAERIRDVIRYLKKFKNALVIIYLEDSLLDSPVFMNHIKDICLIHESGLKVIIVPGASKRIDDILNSAGIKFSYHNGLRITDPSAMPLIKMAAFDVSNQVMTALAGEKKTALIGNWVRARSRGVIDGFDYGTIGEIDKLQTESIETVLNDGFIPIMPCIGWSQAGKPYNISSAQLAQQIASHLKADKLFFLIKDGEINKESFRISEKIGVSDEGTVPALNLEELDLFLSENERYGNPDDERKEKIFSLLHLSRKACEEGVKRAHILNGSIEGIVPCEIFSDLGSGTMIYTSNYGFIRQMTQEDIPDLMKLIAPFVESGRLLPRSKNDLLSSFQNFIVYELDGAIRACSSLTPYSDGQMEIGAVAVDTSYSHIGIGPKMIKCLTEKARNLKATGLFLLTTQASDWFENLGFAESTVESLPEERRKTWTVQRGSKVYRLY